MSKFPVIGITIIKFRNYCQFALLYLLNSKLQMQRALQTRSRRVFDFANNHGSLIKLGQRQYISHSTSRNKRYFKIQNNGNRKQAQNNNSLTKKSLKSKHIGNQTNDYGLNTKNYQKNIQYQKNSFVGESKLKTKNNQPLLKNVDKLVKNIKSKNHRKYSQKACSLDSVIRFNDYATPKKKPSDNNVLKTSYVDPQNEHSLATPQSRKYIDMIQSLKKWNQYYTDMYLCSRQQIQNLRRQNEHEKQKYERVSQIYRHKIAQLNNNKQACKKNLGHIFSYESTQTQFVPNEVIVQNSVECSLQDIKNSVSRKTSQFNNSKISTLSVNSR